jgi:hypothetical protein
MMRNIFMVTVGARIERQQPIDKSIASKAE